MGVTDSSFWSSGIPRTGDPASGSLLYGYGPYDLLVYGATPSGISAAVAASRHGLKVAIFEPTGWVGGMMTGGITHTDVSETVQKGVVVNWPDQLYRRIAEEGYGVSQNNFWVNSYNGEPSMNLRFITRALNEAGVQVVLNAQLASVAKLGSKITSVSFSGRGGVVSARYFIDATHEGDLAAQSGCTTVIGREANSTYGETNNGVRGLAIGAVQFPNGVDPYVTAGAPSSGLLPGVTSTPLAAIGTGDGGVQAMCYRLLITTDGANKVAFPEPEHYDPMRYELLGRSITAGLTLNAMTDMFNLTGVRGGANFDCNNKACVSLDYMGPEVEEWITASYARRIEIAAKVKDYTLGLFKWLKTDSRVPAVFKANLATYGLVRSEWGDNGNFPPALYVREGRRVVGDYVMKEGDLILANGVTDPIALAYYMADSHPVQWVISGGMVKSEGQIDVTVPPGIPVSYRVLLPKQAECTNLWVTSSMSTSRVVHTSLRMEPILMAMGYAAGAAAAIASARGCTSRAVPYSELSRIIDIRRTQEPKSVVMDPANSLATGAVTQNPASSWTISTSQFGWIGAGYASDGNTGKGKTLTYQPNLREPGNYRILAMYPTGTGQDASRANNVPITIAHAAGTTNLVLNQQSGGQGGDWDDLGVYPFAAGTPSANSVVVGTTGTSSFVIGPALKFVKQ